METDGFYVCTPCLYVIVNMFRPTTNGRFRFRYGNTNSLAPVHPCNLRADLKEQTYSGQNGLST